MPTMKNKSRVLSYFIKNDCKVGTIFQNKSKNKSRKIVARVPKGTYMRPFEQDIEISSVDIFVEDELGNIYFDNVHYSRKAKVEVERFENINSSDEVLIKLIGKPGEQMDRASLKEMTDTLHSLERASKLTTVLTENTIYIY